MIDEPTTYDCAIQNPFPHSDRQYLIFPLAAVLQAGTGIGLLGRIFAGDIADAALADVGPDGLSDSGVPSDSGGCTP